MNDTNARRIRPWPVPERQWIMRQVWHDLLFAHWRVPVEHMRLLVPQQLHLDLFDGEAWIGVVPFRMSGVTARHLPAIPWLSAFPELNVRTYVTYGDRPGVYFFSLDAGNPVAVWAARRFYYLPYFNAAMHSTHRDDTVSYQSVRTHRGAPPAALRVTYRPTGPLRHDTPDSLDRWLTDRFCLYTTDHRGRVIRQEIDHADWPLRPAEAEFRSNTMTAPLGIDLCGHEPLLHFSDRLEVRIWSQDRV